MGGADPCKNCGRKYPLSTPAYEFAMRDDDGECFPDCFTCFKHIGRHDEPRAHTCEECYKSHCDNCCGDPTTYDEHGCCADCAPGDVAVPVAEEVVAGAPTAADDDAADADDAAQVTAAMAQVAVAAGGADSSPSGSSSSDSDSDGDGDDGSKGRGSGAEAVVANAEEFGRALASKPYSELQAMAKARGIRANTKKKVMVKALNEAAGEQ